MDRICVAAKSRACAGLSPLMGHLCSLGCLTYITPPYPEYTFPRVAFESGQLPIPNPGATA